LGAGPGDEVTARRAGPAGFRSRRGSASAVVVMVTVLLAVFGVLALVSSYSGYKLSQRHAAWTTAYYDVDARAEAALAAIEGDLSAAATEAGNVSATGAFPSLAALALADRVPEGQGTVLGDAQGFTVRINVGDADGQLIRVELRVDFQEGAIPSRLCRIVSWRQWQKPFAYDENPGDVWGGEG
jgi:hypothetical protein